MGDVGLCCMFRCCMYCTYSTVHEMKKKFSSSVLFCLFIYSSILFLSFHFIHSNSI